MAAALSSLENIRSIIVILQIPEFAGHLGRSLNESRFVVPEICHFVSMYAPAVNPRQAQTTFEVYLDNSLEA